MCVCVRAGVRAHASDSSSLITAGLEKVGDGVGVVIRYKLPMMLMFTAL